MKILYFATLKDRIGAGEEDIALPEGVATVGDLVAWLTARGPGYAQAFANMAVVRAAVNQQYATPTHPVAERDEVAFFPPVTGGASS